MSAVPVPPPPAPRRRRMVRPLAIFAVLGPGRHRRERGQRRRWDHDLRVGRVRVRLLDALRHGARHRGARRRPGDVARGSARTPAKGSSRSCASSSRCAWARSPSRALLVANLGLVVSEFAGIGAAMEIFGVSRYISVPIVRRGDLQRRRARLVQAGRADLPAAVARVPRVPGLDGARGSRTGARSRRTRSGRTSSTAEAFLFLAVAIIGTTITPYMQLYQAAAVADRGIGPDEYPAERIDTDRGLDLRQPHRDVDHHRHRGDDRRDRSARVGGRGGEGARAGRRRGRGDALRDRPARRVAARGRGRPVVDRLRRRRGRRRGAFGVAPVPRGAAVPRPVHRAGRDRRRRSR